MSRVSERQGYLAATRKGPLVAKLRRTFEEAAVEAGIDLVVCFSGGQPATGPNRVGSHRHDNGMAGDVWTEKDGRILDFTKPDDRQLIAAFITACAKRGVSGIGADVGYMGPNRIHLGYGPRAIWGDGGHVKSADPWLVNAVRLGWDAPSATPHPILARGDKGSEVDELQKLLTAKGYPCGNIDGDLGAKTEAAVEQFQAAMGLEVDGITGPLTWAKLEVAP